MVERDEADLGREIRRRGDESLVRLDQGDVEAVREKNTEDPSRKIYEGPPAVQPAVT